MKKRILLSTIVILVGVFCWCVWSFKNTIPYDAVQKMQSSLNSEPEYKEVQKTQGSLNFEPELDRVIAGMKVFAKQLPQEAVLASDVIKECESMKVLFRESFTSPKGSIDFILMVHSDPLNRVDPKVSKEQGFDIDHSRELVFRTILKNKYDLVAVEGSCLDGFSLEAKKREVFKRLRYHQREPLARSLIARGVNIDSYDSVQRYITPLVKLKITNDWSEFEKKTTSSFVAGESAPFTSLLGKFLSGEIYAERTDLIIESLQRLRSAYVLAKTIHDLKRTSSERAAIVFGFLHKDDFIKMASVLNLEARICDATGVDWDKVKKRRSQL